MLVTCLIPVLMVFNGNKVITEATLTGEIIKRTPSYANFSKDASKYRGIVGDYSDVRISNLKCVNGSTK